MRVPACVTMLLFLFVLLLAEDEPPIGELLKKSDLIVVGKAGKNETLDAGNAPGMILKNTVTVEESLKGEGLKEVTVSYVGYHPKLKINHLKEGEKYIFFLKKGGWRGKADYSLVDGNYGALPATAALLDAIKKALKGPEEKEEKKSKRRYALLIPRGLEKEGGWGKVVKELKKKHSARLFRYNDLNDVKEDVAKYRPYYVCFVRKPQNCGRGFVKSVIGFMRQLDTDPYDDAVWAILTGRTAEDALKIAKAKPLEVKRHLSHIGGGWLEWFERGVSFCEGRKFHKTIKKKGKKPEVVKGPGDTTEQWVKEVNSNKVDIISTSGHATERDWNMGYKYRSGKIVPAGKGMLKGLSSKRRQYLIRTSNPKIYYSPGNCLIAHIPSNFLDCMCLSWIHNGCYHFFGHIEPQTRWCTAWGISEYFFKLQDTYTFAEAVCVNRIAARYITDNHKGGREKQYWNRCLGITVLYGDPAWEAKMKRIRDPLYEMILDVKDTEEGRKKATLTVKFNHKCKIHHRNTPVLLLPFFISDWKVEKSDANRTLICDNFVLLDLLEKEFKKGDEIKLVFTFKVEE